MCALARACAVDNIRVSASPQCCSLAHSPLQAPATSTLAGARCGVCALQPAPCSRSPTLCQPASAGASLVNAASSEPALLCSRAAAWGPASPWRHPRMAIPLHERRHGAPLPPAGTSRQERLWQALAAGLAPCPFSCLPQLIPWPHRPAHSTAPGRPAPPPRAPTGSYHSHAQTRTPHHESLHPRRRRALGCRTPGLRWASAARPARRR